jgi:hypothetical protein
MFPYIETHEALKANLTYLTPGQAPYYWIVIALEFAGFNAATELRNGQWWATLIVVAIILLMCGALAVKQMSDLPEETSRTQVRVARIVGVSTPFLALAFTMSKLRLDTGLFVLALSMTLVQAFTFLFLVKEEPLRAGKSVNVPQLLVICTSLLFATHAVIGSLSMRQYLLDLPAEMLTGYGIPAKEAKDWSIEMYEKQRIASRLLGSEAGPLVSGIYGVIDDVSGDKPFVRGIHRAHIDSARYQSANLQVLGAFFAALWIVVLVRTAFHARSAARV